MSIAIGIVALLLIQWPLGCSIGRHLQEVSNDYRRNEDPFDVGGA